MAKRRMFSLDIIDTDLFLEMPQTTRLLYYELCMRADDDGFVSNPKKIQRVVGCNEDDFRVLITKKFLIPFDTGVVVIRHWKIHNYIQKDRYKETIYYDEKKQLKCNENGSYELMDTECIQNGYTGKDRLELELGKVRIVEEEKPTTTIFEYLEYNFGYSISPIIVEKINVWLEYFNEDIIKYAIDKCCMANVRQFNYLEGILKNWKSKGYKKIEECKQETKKQKQESIPEWYGKEQEETKVTDEQRKEMEELLKEFT